VIGTAIWTWHCLWIGQCLYKIATILISTCRSTILPADCLPLFEEFKGVLSYQRRPASFRFLRGRLQLRLLACFLALWRWHTRARAALGCHAGCSSRKNGMSNSEFSSASPPVIRLSVRTLTTSREVHYALSLLSSYLGTCSLHVRTCSSRETLM
jgi:hypothetical protein